MKKSPAPKNIQRKSMRKNYLFVEELGNATKITLGIIHGMEWGGPGGQGMIR